MLDNFDGKGIHAAARQLKHEWANLSGAESRKFYIEASGGLTEDNCIDYFSPDVDILSFGSLSQSGIYFLIQ